MDIGIESFTEPVNNSNGIIVDDTEELMVLFAEERKVAIINNLQMMKHIVTTTDNATAVKLLSEIDGFMQTFGDDSSKWLQSIDSAIETLEISIESSTVADVVADVGTAAPWVAISPKFALILGGVIATMSLYLQRIGRIRGKLTSAVAKIQEMPDSGVLISTANSVPKKDQGVPAMAAAIELVDKLAKLAPKLATSTTGEMQDVLSTLGFKFKGTASAIQDNVVKHSLGDTAFGVAWFTSRYMHPLTFWGVFVGAIIKDASADSVRASNEIKGWNAASFRTFANDTLTLLGKFDNLEAMLKNTEAKAKTAKYTPEQLAVFKQNLKIFKILISGLEKFVSKMGRGVISIS